MSKDSNRLRYQRSRNYKKVEQRVVKLRMVKDPRRMREKLRSEELEECVD